MNAYELEQLLNQVRGSACELNREDALARIGAYEDYYLLLIDGKLSQAPDDRRRALAAIFTTEVARERYRDWLPKGRSQVILATAAGCELFPALHALPLTGVVFNCCGPGKPIAFTPSLVQWIVERLDTAASRGDSLPLFSALADAPSLSSAYEDELSPAPNFDALQAEAFDSSSPGPTPARNALWTTLLQLEDWFYVVRPEDVDAPQPLIAPFEHRQSVFAFTDYERAVRFARDNHILTQDGEPIVLNSTPELGIQWMEQQLAAGQADHVQFNFGDAGWFAPICNLRNIQQHLGLGN